jgi:hypothetical protein
MHPHAESVNNQGKKKLESGNWKTEIKN